MLGPLVISLKDELVFIKSILIPAFNPDNELETSKQRNEWMRMRAISTHWDAGIYEKLLIRYGTVTSLDEAKLEKAETERKFAEVEVEVERKLKVEIQWKLEMVEMQRKLEMVEMQRKLKMVEAEMQRKLEMVEAEMQRKLEMVVAEAERKLEMVEVERKLSKKSIISFSFIVFTLILSFVCIAITC